MQSSRSVCVFVLSVVLIVSTFAAEPPRIELQIDPAIRTQPYSGRIYIAMWQRPTGNPIDRVGWYSLDPLFSTEVNDWKPGETLAFDFSKARAYPAPVSDLASGKYRVQAAVDFNGQASDVLRGEGNGFSKTVEYEYPPSDPSPLKIKIDQTRSKWSPKGTDTQVYVTLKSHLLSEFHKRDVSARAVILLPNSYAEQTERRFPSVYVISGFGGTLLQAGPLLKWMQNTISDESFQPAFVFIDSDCANGHHAWANSDNNGPWGRVLTEELIPHLEKEYRLISDADARYITGVSSGGWASLWAQVVNPDFFGGVWACSPDPVDFSAFQSIDIYDPAQNFLTLADGSPRPLSRSQREDKRDALFVGPFSQLEETLGRAGQLQSFDAVFGPRSADGRVVPLWDRTTGRIDTKVVEHWKKYDIRLKLENEWKTLGPKLAGKLHLYCGDKDTFLLDGAFTKLADTLKKLGSDAYVELMPGVAHTVTDAQMQTIAAQMRKQFAERYLSRAASKP